jgi:hypothetical protein
MRSRAESELQLGGDLPRATSALFRRFGTTGGRAGEAILDTSGSGVDFEGEAP